MSSPLAGIDYAVLAVYLAATLALGLYIGRRIHTGADFFLGGRRLPWWAIGMSLVATDIGGTDIIGVGGAAYSHGLAVANFEWIGCIPAMIVAAFVFIPFFYRTGIYTVPEFLERRYNVAVRTALAACWLCFMACNLGIMLYASATTMSVLFGWNVAACIWATALLVGFYTCVGGLAAVVYTDMIQCAVMIAGCLLVLVLGLRDIGGIGQLSEQLHAVRARPSVSSPGETAAENRTEAESADGSRNSTPRPPHSSAPDGASDPRTSPTSLVVPVDGDSPFPWTGIFFGLALVLSPAYWIGNQAIVQRSLGARSEFEAKASYVWGAVLKNVIPLVIAVPGLIAMVRFPNLVNGDEAFPRLVTMLLPTGLRGLFLAAFIAALMSSVDSYLNSAATIVTNDVYRRFINPHAGESAMLRIGRLATLALVGYAIVFAFLLTRLNEGIYTVFQTLMAFFQGPALAVLLCGLLWRRATGTAAFVSFVSGVLFSMTLFALSQPAVFQRLELEPLFQIPDPYLYFSVWAFLLTLFLLVTLSLLTRPEPPEKLRYCVSIWKPVENA